MLWDIDNTDEIDWRIAQAQADTSNADPVLSSCVRCQCPINPDEVFCGECYHYLDERGYFES